MDEINSLIGGFGVALSWYNLFLMVVGILLGVIIGVLPGLGGANGVAILLPLTFPMAQVPGGATSAIILLSCIYWGALFGGAITSILFNIPGEPWSVATTFDGHPMARQGKADEALTAAFTSSFVGALVAVIVITFLAPVIARFALRFGPAEFFSVFFLTFASFVGMGGSVNDPRKRSPMRLMRWTGPPSPGVRNAPKSCTAISAPFGEGCSGRSIMAASASGGVRCRPCRPLRPPEPPVPPLERRHARRTRRPPHQSRAKARLALSPCCCWLG